MVEMSYQASTNEPPSPVTGDSISISNSQCSFRGSRLSCTNICVIYLYTMNFFWDNFKEYSTVQKFWVCKIF